MAAEAVLLDLKAHELLLGQWLAQDLLQPDRVHSVFHSCRILRAHTAIVTSASDALAACNDGRPRSFAQIPRFLKRMRLDAQIRGRRKARNSLRS